MHRPGGAKPTSREASPTTRPAASSKLWRHTASDQPPPEATQGSGDMEGTSGCDRLRPVAVPPGMPSTGMPDRSVPGL